MTVLAFLAILALGLLFGPWIFMLFIGNAHAQDTRIPAFGFWTCFWLEMALASVVGGAVKSVS